MSLGVKKCCIIPNPAAVASLVASPPYWKDIPGRKITCLRRREIIHHADEIIISVVFGSGMHTVCSHAKVRKKNNSAPGKDCLTGAGVIHHAETHTE